MTWIWRPLWSSGGRPSTEPATSLATIANEGTGTSAATTLRYYDLTGLRPVYTARAGRFRVNTGMSRTLLNLS